MAGFHPEGRRPCDQAARRAALRFLDKIGYYKKLGIGVMVSKIQGI